MEKYVKLAIGMGLGAYVGYQITNSSLGAIVGLLLGGYLSQKLEQ